jgi:hypothetical protein
MFWMAVYYHIDTHKAADIPPVTNLSREECDALRTSSELWKNSLYLVCKPQQSLIKTNRGEYFQW